MKGLSKSLFAKVIALFVLVISLVTGIGCVIGFSYIFDQGYYSERQKSFFQSDSFERQAYRDANEVADYTYNGYDSEKIDKTINIDNLNYSYRVYLDNVTVTAEDDVDVLEWLENNGQKYQLPTKLDNEKVTEETEVEAYEKSNTLDFDMLYTEGGDIDESDVVHQYDSYFTYEYWIEEDEIFITEQYYVELDFREPVEIQDTYYNLYKLNKSLYSLRYWVIILGLLMAVIFIADFIYLMCAAGHRPGTDEIVPNWQDKIPFDVYLLGIFILMFLDGCAFAVIVDSWYYMTDPIVIIGVGVTLVILAMLCLACLMTFATRVKMGGFWRNTLIYKILKAVFGSVSDFFGNINLVLKWMAAFVVLCIINLFGIFAFPITIIIDALAFMWLYKQLIGLNKLKEAGKSIAAGNLDEKVDTTKLKGDLKAHGENLNSIGVGMAKAVDQKMRSERFRTELITNVSHDIKTPLTSIINYVDLIRKEEPEGKIDEYSQVLEKQANRLKKLLEDLLEASKASTGNMAVDFEKTDVCEIVNQAVGEYSEKMEEKNIEVIVTLPEEETFVMADGRKLWRIFDNILNNIYKYAQSGTRAYVDVINKDGKVIIAFKNISKDRLNIDSDELMERFVRGDGSRNTEGSGLGLNIAKSFAELQKAKFDITVDGDLFKAEIVFERA